MKHFKMLGLAVVLAGALMAFIGANTALATMGSLCKNNTTTEMCSELYGVGTVVSAQLQSGAEVVLTNSVIGAVDTCKKSSISGKLGSEGSTASTASGGISSLIWEECTCETKTIKNGELSFSHTAGTMDGELWGKNIEVTLNGCAGGLHCVLGSGEGLLTLGIVTGGNPAIFAEYALMKRVGGRSGALCGSSSEWHTQNGAYEITEPKPLFISTG